MATVIIVSIPDSYQPQEGTPFDAVVSALNHFEIQSVVSKAEGDELVDALRQCESLLAELADGGAENPELDVVRNTLAKLEGR